MREPARLAVIDTNVVAGALTTRESQSPTARIFAAMATGHLRFLLSEELLAEYATVLRRPRIRSQSGLNPDEISEILERLASNGETIALEPYAGPVPPDPKDAHLWALLVAVPSSVLITGDRTLREATRGFAVALTPREFTERFGL